MRIQKRKVLSKSSVTRRILKVVLMERLALSFTQEGFAQTDFGFVRKHSTDVLHIFRLTFLDGVGPSGKLGWRIDPGAAVRLEAVEKLYHLTSGFNLKDQRGTATIGNSVGGYLAGRSSACEFAIDSEEQIDDVLAQISEVFHKFALPYFAKYSTLSAIDAALNEKPTEKTPHRTAVRHAYYGTIVAKLMGRKDYPELVRIYTEVLTNQDRGFYLKRFLDLLTALENQPPMTAERGVLA